MNPKRTVFIDVETTGLELSEGHRIVGIGAIEVLDEKMTAGRTFDQYFNPQRLLSVEFESFLGLSNELLATQPLFSSHAPELWELLADSVLVSHHATFDLKFLQQEFDLAGCRKSLSQHCTTTDIATIARKNYPNKRADLHSLCQRFGIVESDLTPMSMLTDARRVMKIYFEMSRT